MGHSDIMIGTAVANTRTWDKLREHSYLMGQMVDADSAYTTARGIRTLGVRLKQHHESSLKVAKWLSEQPQVKAVYHQHYQAAQVMKTLNVILRVQAVYSLLNYISV